MPTLEDHSHYPCTKSPPRAVVVVVLWLLSLGLLWLLWLLLRPPCVEPARAAFNCKLWLLLWRWWWWWWWWFGQ